MNNWLQIAVGAYLLGMVLYGHYRGFLRLAVSLSALFLTLAIVNIAMPKVSALVKENTPVYGWIEEGVADSFRPSDEADILAEEDQAIESLNLPDNIKQLLVENNTDKIYEILGVDAFAEYIGSYLANMILNLVGYVVLFVVVYILIRLIMRGLNVMARLPILSGINQLAGAALGGVEGLFYLWLASLLVTACISMPWARAVIDQIESSTWLSFLYQYNLLSRLATGILKTILS